MVSVQSIRRARPGDEPHITRFIRDLARYEHLEHHLNLSEARQSEHLFGETPESSFFVKCDTETNPPEVIDAGQMICDTVQEMACNLSPNVM